MPRRARLDAPGTLHHVIVRGIEKRRIVRGIADRKDFIKRLAKLSIDTKTSIYAWALMTNHAHILLRSSEIGLSGFMRRLLTGYAVSYNRRHHRWGHLFQNRYKSIICDEDAYFKEADAKIKCQLSVSQHHRDIGKYIAKACKKEKVSIEELKAGSRRKQVSGARGRIVIELVKGHGIGQVFRPRVRNMSLTAPATNI